MLSKNLLTCVIANSYFTLCYLNLYWDSCYLVLFFYLGFLSMFLLLIFHGRMVRGTESQNVPLSSRERPSVPRPEPMLEPPDPSDAEQVEL